MADNTNKEDSTVDKDSCIVYSTDRFKPIYWLTHFGV